MTRMLNDDEIKKQIIQILEGTDFYLISFERNDKFFGNMIVVIKSSKKKYTFVTDRDDIFCNTKLIIPHGYHVAGEDDVLGHLMKVIKQTLQPSIKPNEKTRASLFKNLKTKIAYAFWRLTNKSRMR